MGLSKIQKSMIDMGVKQLAKWIKEEKGGEIALGFEEINKWLNEHDYDFKLVYLCDPNDQILVRYKGE